MGRDVLFVRTKAATFALQAVVAHYNQQRRAASAPATDGAPAGTPGDSTAPGAGGGGGDTAAAEPRSPGGTSKVVVVQGEGGAGGEGEPARAAPDQAGTPAGGDSSSEEEEDEEEEEKREEEEAAARRQLGEPWVEGLRYGEYDALPLEHRVAMLGALCHLAVDSPSIRCAAAGGRKREGGKRERLQTGPNAACRCLRWSSAWRPPTRQALLRAGLKAAP